MKSVMIGIVSLCCLALVAGSVLQASDTPGGSPPPTGKQPTETDYRAVEAVFSKHLCGVCHGATAPRAGLSLDSYQSLMKGGKSGPAVVPGKPAESELIRRLSGVSEPRMPFTGPPWLTDDEMRTIEAWVAAGAPGPR